MNRTSVSKQIAIIVCFLSASFAHASESNGTITSGSHLTRVCKDTTCTTPAPGIINFRPTGTTAVTIEDTAGIDGIGWGSEIGWITFDPTGPEAVTINATSGEISGKAWAQGAGWVNFRPANSGTTSLGIPIGVSINNNGEFYGWAWTGGPHGGWIKFDCANASTCIKTDWRPTGVRGVVTPPTPTPTPAPNGSPSGGNDLCANILGTQLTVPVGYTFDGGVCTAIPVDACDNLPGFQAGVPQGYVLDTGGMCVLPIDYCGNIDGVQQQVPLGLVVRGDGTCGAPQPITIEPVDIDGDGIVDVPRFPSGEVIGTFPTIFDPNASTIPEYLRPYTERFTDYCRNLEGFQASVPLGFVTDTVGWCVPAYVDYCPNIDGEQAMIPSNLFINESGACVTTDERKYLYPVEEGKKIISLSIVPPDVRVPLDWRAAAAVLEGIAGVQPDSVDLPSVASTGTPNYPVDFVSILLLLDMIIVITLGTYLFGRKLFGLI